MQAIYLDHAATTPVRREVVEAMAPYLDVDFGNPSSVHAFGRRAAAALEDARARLAGALGAHASEIVFVRGGTEADNLAVFGVAGRVRAEGRAPALAVSAIEHPAVLEAARAAAGEDGAFLTIP
ncbi:MAG: aminotransferase class V-fold PLP-dependent enzyme, partial [Gemmatimonadetes bacterium]